MNGSMIAVRLLWEYCSFLRGAKGPAAREGLLQLTTCEYFSRSPVGVGEFDIAYIQLSLVIWYWFAIVYGWEGARGASHLWLTSHLMLLWKSVRTGQSPGCMLSYGKIELWSGFSVADRGTMLFSSFRVTQYWCRRA